MAGADVDDGLGLGVAQQRERQGDGENLVGTYAAVVPFSIGTKGSFRAINDVVQVPARLKPEPLSKDVGHQIGLLAVLLGCFQLAQSLPTGLPSPAGRCATGH